MPNSSIAPEDEVSGGFVRQAIHSREFITEQITALHSTTPTKPITSDQAKFKLTKASAREEVRMDEHIVSVEELQTRFDLVSLSQGLASESIVSRQQLHGKNMLTPPKKTPWFFLLLKELTHGFALLLWFGAALCFVAYVLDATKDKNNLYLGAALAVAVTLTGVYGFWQNFRSSKALEALKDLTAPTATVRRNGQVRTIAASEVCLGDVVLLSTGERVPADLRLIESAHLKVEQAALTGETEEIGKSLDMTSENPLETANLVFAGTMVVNGTGVGVVVNIGDFTVVGRIATLVTQTDSEVSTLHLEISHFVKIISVVAISISLLFAGLGIVFSKNANWQARIIDNLVFAISLIVANVPEGLLTTVTISVVFAALALKRKGVLIKNLSTVETLGSCNCICSDKTQTLTTGVMTASHLLVVGHDPASLKAADGPTDASYAEDLLRCATLCNDASPGPKTADDSAAAVTGGNASDQGILRYLEAAGPGKTALLRAAYPLRAKAPFNSKVKLAMAVCEFSLSAATAGKEADILLLLKGAPEAVLKRCVSIRTSKGTELLTETLQQAVEAGNAEFARKGERVLGFAQRLVRDEAKLRDCEWDLEAGDVGEFEFLGLMSLVDPPREGVREAVEKCHRAGIQVIMVTGDQPLTAEAIAKEVAIIRAENPAGYVVVHGEELGKMDEGRLEKILENGEKDVVFARTTPTQKLRIAETLKKLGRVVAMTGDGVNDAPALKAANVGVAMGTGTQVAQQAADIILTSDDFSAIVKGIEQGRLIFDNLKKSIAYTLTSNIPELFPYLLSVILGIPLPLTTPLILAVDLGADIIPAISFAYERPELDIMMRKPRDVKRDRMVNKKLIFFSYGLVGVVQALAGFLTYFQVMRDYGFKPSGLLGLNNLEFLKFEDDGARLEYTSLSWLTNSQGDLRLCGREGLACEGDLLTLAKFQTVCGGQVTSAGQATLTKFGDAAEYGGVLYKHNEIGEAVCPSQADAQGIFWPVGVHSATSQRKMDDATKDTDCRAENKSPVTQAMVCHTTDAVKYAQTSFFVTIVFVQYATLFFCKVRILSLVHQGFGNKVMLLGVVVETAVAAAITYLSFFHTAFNTRPLQPWHFGVGAMPFAVFNLLFDETRKFFMRCAGFGLATTKNAETGDWKYHFGKFLHKYTYY